MKKLVQLLLLMTLPLVVMASELKEGTLSVLLFSEGKPLANNEIKVDGKKVFKTDEDGTVKIPLVAGRHQIEIFGKNVAGENLGYFKKPVSIKEGRDTEVIATLSKTGSDSIDIDIPVAIAKSVERKEEQVSGEGRLSGQILSSEGNTPISGARVFVRGTSVDVRTDEKGRFSAKVPSGKTLSISVVHSAYSAQTMGGIVVKKDGTTSRTVKLTPASMELEEFVVLAPKIEGSIADVIEEEKNINAVANILGSEELSKKGDSDAAAALKRVTGVTLVDGKNIYVRGLGERYSNVEMNSMPLPSPDPLKRSVPLDIFPSNVIGSMKVQKSATADIPSSFGGGYIDVRTKENFDEDYIKLSLGTKFNRDTGTAQIDSVGSATDWTGYDFSYRDIPQTILDATEVHVGEATPILTLIEEGGDFTKEELSDMTRMFVNRIYNVNQSTVLPGISGSIEGAKSFTINDDHEISIFGTYRYDQDHTYRTENYYKYDYDSDGQQNDYATQYGTIEQRAMDISHGGMLNLGYNYLDVLKLKYTKLYTKNSSKITRVTDGILGSNDEHLTIYNLDWNERELNSDQISGEVDYEIFNADSTFNFGLQYSTANYYQPNNYQYIYFNVEPLAYTYNKLQSNHNANRIESDDVLKSLYLKNKHDLELFNKDEYIEYGINISSKERISRQKTYRLRKEPGSLVPDEYMTQEIDTLYQLYVLPDYPYEYRPFLLSSFVQPADYFDGYVDEKSPYVSCLVRPDEKLEVVAGVRYVSLKQQIDEYVKDVLNPDPLSRNNIVLSTKELEVNEFFPSMSVKYKYDDKNVFDIAASKTYIMPDLREVSGVYSHPFEPASIMGNPELVNTTIYNLDFKYSYFISEDEYIKSGIFYKYMDKPIEDVQLLAPSLPVYSFANSDYATLYGFELDWRKNFDFINAKWTNYYIAGNFSYNFSEVSLTEEQKLKYTNNKRALQGLSPYVFNMTLGYDNDNRSISFNTNYMSERIRKVGVIDGSISLQDQYETPPILMDLVWIEKLDYGYPLELKVKAGNLLDDETVWKEGDGITRYYKTGPTLDLKVSAKF